MSHSRPFSISHNNPEADDSSTVFDADTVIPDEVSSFPAMPPLPTLTATATDYHHQQPNNYENISSISTQEESPANTISELLRRINSRHRRAEPSTTTVTATAAVYDANTVMPGQARSEEMRPIIINSSVKRKQPQENSSSTTTKKSSTKRPRRSSTAKVSKREARWRSKFEQLRAYKRSNGNVNVPRSDEQLGKWVNTQRTEYRKFKKNNGKGKITPERIEMLESIGFEWELFSEWNKRFNELKDYKEKYGRTNVPVHNKDNKKLGLWVNTQRTEYKKFEKNEKAYITKERIQMLESIGFEWVCQKYESLWNKRFTELSAYKEKFGDTNVSRSENKELGIWVNNQRTGYKKFQQNKKSSMTLERIELLNSIGFQWECRRSRSPRS